MRPIKLAVFLLALTCACTVQRGTVSFGAEQKSPQTDLYGIGSTSKVVTAALVMKLAGEGKIDLDKPLSSYIPEFSMADSRYVLITPRMLLDHTSGIPGGTLNNAMLLGEPNTDNHDRILDRLKTQRLKADPGDFAVYCNDGFTLAEILVERVSGISFTRYLEQELAAPLGITNLKTPQSPDFFANLAPVYDRRTGKVLPPEAANVIGSGGIYATADDLCRLSQVFMRDQGFAAGILKPELSKAMEYSEYDKAMNPDGRDSILSYGLGWDSTAAYPFNRYGIKALNKGGDTSYYNASLTVLPEENISCAVLTSSGSSTACQLAVQEILLSYLEEIGRIERKEDSDLYEDSEVLNPQLSSLPENLEDFGGWYAGWSMLDVNLTKTGELTLSVSGTGKDRTQTYTYRQDGAFHSDSSGYIGMDETLTRGGDGRTGRSSLNFYTDSRGRTFLMAQTRETYPGLGTAVSYMPVAEKITPAAPEEGDLKSFRAVSGKEFYLISEKYSSTLYTTRFMVKPWVSDRPGGYLTFDGEGMPAAKITGPGTAQFFQQLPGQKGRDLMDYRMTTTADGLYLDGGTSRYLCEDNMDILPKQDMTVTIASTGQPQWFTLNSAENYGFVSIFSPEKGAYYVYDATKKEPACIASSYVAESEKSFLLPREGKLLFAGEPGEAFTIRFSR